MIVKIFVFSFLGIGFLVAVMAAGWALLLKRFLDRLKRDHPSTFDQLGRPRFGGDIAAHKTPQLLNFLIRRKDRQLGDAALSRLCRIMFWWWWAFSLVFVMMLVAMVWMQLKLHGIKAN
ncbi:MAG: hypothetical protein ACRETO_09820 [Gammaproteobacteria bacterium]